ncbi:MAG: hypothetical protein K2M91_16985, partial [Lachnospiraceae bacterium]|nr:hypothetical protein [Lachnospiraceae bacterium]
ESGYSGSIKKTYKITPADMASAVSVLPANPLDDSIKKSGEGTYHLNGANGYTASGVKPSKRIRLILGTEQEPSAVLTEGKDYTVKYTNNSVISTTEPPTMTITGKGNCAGTLAVTFNIDKAQLKENANLAVTAPAVSYNAKKADDYQYQPKIKVTDGKKTLKAGKDYVVDRYEHCSQKEVRDYLQAKEDGAAENVLQAMRPYVVITAAPDSCYSGTMEADLTIYKIKLTAKALYVVITDDPEQTTYTGEQLRPDVTVYYGDPKAVKEARKAEITAERTLTSQEGKYKLTRLKMKEGQNNGDYTLTYGNNIKAGKKAGSITVNGSGLYGGKVTVKFMIQGEDVYDSTVEPWSLFTEKLKLIFAQ